MAVANAFFGGVGSWICLDVMFRGADGVVEMCAVVVRDVDVIAPVVVLDFA